MKRRIMIIGIVFILLSLFIGCGVKTNGKIVFVSNHGISVMNADGTGQTLLTTTGSLPMWSPDRKKIVFVSNRDGNTEIYVMNADGTNQTRLTNGGGDFPVWSFVSSWSW